MYLKYEILIWISLSRWNDHVEADARLEYMYKTQVELYYGK